MPRLSPFGYNGVWRYVLVPGGASLGDTVGVTASLSTSVALRTSLADTVGVTDSFDFEYVTAHHIRKHLSDTDDISASHSVRRDIHVFLADTVGITDSLHIPLHPYADAVIADGPWLFWKLDELSGPTARDYSGNGNDGTYISNSLTYGATPGLTADEPSRAVHFNQPGATQYGQGPNGGFAGPFPHFTFETLIYVPSNASTSSDINGYYWEFGGNGGMYLFSPSGTSNVDASLGWFTTGGSFNSSNSASFTRDTIHHLACVYDGTNAIIYIDGTAASTLAQTGGMVFPFALQLEIGAYQYNLPPVTFDEAAFYSTALSPTDVSNHYAAVSAGGYSTAVLANSPEVYWRLGDASGTTMVDSSGHGRDGIYIAGPTLGVPGLLTGDSDTAVTFQTPQPSWVQSAPWISHTYSSFTFEVIMELDQSHDSNFRTVIALSGSGFSEIYVRKVSGIYTIYLDFEDSPSSTFPFCHTTINDDGVTRYHVVGVWDGNVAYLYLNGVQVASDSSYSGHGGTFTFDSGDRFYVASDGFSGDELDGKFADGAFYPYALNAGQVANHYSKITNPNTPSFIDVVGIIDSLSVSFTRPTITSVVPNTGNPGDQVTIHGTRLLSVVDYKFGTFDAGGWSPFSNTQTNSVIVPSNNTPQVSVSIYDSFGFADSYNYFNYFVPHTTAITPNTGKVGYSTAVTLTGTGFTGAVSVSFGGLIVTSIHIVNDTTLTCDAPPVGLAGPVTVQVQGAVGGAGGATFTYVAVASAFSPNVVGAAGTGIPQKMKVRKVTNPDQNTPAVAASGLPLVPSAKVIPRPQSKSVTLKDTQVVNIDVHPVKATEATPTIASIPRETLIPSFEGYARLPQHVAFIEPFRNSMFGIYGVYVGPGGIGTEPVTDQGPFSGDQNIPYYPNHTAIGLYEIVPDAKTSSGLNAHIFDPVIDLGVNFPGTSYPFTPSLVFTKYKLNLSATTMVFSVAYGSSSGNTTHSAIRILERNGTTLTMGPLVVDYFGEFDLKPFPGNNPQDLTIQTLFNDPLSYDGNQHAYPDSMDWVRYDDNSFFRGWWSIFGYVFQGITVSGTSASIAAWDYTYSTQAPYNTWGQTTFEDGSPFSPFQMITNEKMASGMQGVRWEFFTGFVLLSFDWTPTGGVTRVYYPGSVGTPEPPGAFFTFDYFQGVPGAEGEDQGTIYYYNGGFSQFWVSWWGHGVQQTSYPTPVPSVTSYPVQFPNFDTAIDGNGSSGAVPLPYTSFGIGNDGSPFPPVSSYFVAHSVITQSNASFTNITPDPDPGHDWHTDFTWFDLTRGSGVPDANIGAFSNQGGPSSFVRQLVGLPATDVVVYFSSYTYSDPTFPFATHQVNQLAPFTVKLE